MSVHLVIKFPGLQIQRLFLIYYPLRLFTYLLCIVYNGFIHSSFLFSLNFIPHVLAPMSYNTTELLSLILPFQTDIRTRKCILDRWVWRDLSTRHHISPRPRARA